MGILVVITFIILHWIRKKNKTKMQFLYLVTFLTFAMVARSHRTGVCHDDLSHCEDLDCRKIAEGCKKTCGLCDLSADETDAVDACVDMDTNCPVIAENNWCNEEGFKGRCCLSCDLAEKTKDLSCHDVGAGCVAHKTHMCKHYPDECKKTCNKC